MTFFRVHSKCLRLTFCLYFWLGDQKPSQHQPESLIPQCNVPKILPKPQTIPSLFTSTPVSSRFKTPIFQFKDSRKDLDQCVNLSVVNKDSVSASDQAVKGQTEVVPPNEIPPDLPLQSLSLSPDKTPPYCVSNQETSVAGPVDVEEEDQSIFYTPELFEGEDEESAAAAIEENEESATAATEESPLQMDQLLCPIGKMADRQPEELFRSKKGQTRTCADSSDVKGAAAFPERDCVSPNRDCMLSESIAEQAGVSCSIGTEDRATREQYNSSSKSRRLSRSRQKASSREAGKPTSPVSQGSQPQVITIDD